MVDYAWVLEKTLQAAGLAVGGFGVWVAYRGLQTWRRQLFGQVAFDHARRVKLAAYKVRDHIRTCRVGIYEGNSSALLGALAEKYSAFDNELLDAEVLWGGSSISELRAAVWRCVSEFAINARNLFHLAEKMEGGYMPPDDEFAKTDSAVYGLDEDDYGQKLRAAIKTVEDYVRPHLPSPPK